MDRVEQNLNEAIILLNKREKPLESERDFWAEQLTSDLLYLDGTESSPQRREMIHAIQNILSQLEHLYQSEKPPILLHSPVEIRDEYLPKGRDSHYALGNSFQ